jgi:hypothetical protein
MEPEPLLSRIQDGIACGALPSVDCLVTWYGQGRGQLCGACNQRILGTEVGIDCDLPDGTTIRFHARCYELWRSLVSP